MKAIIAATFAATLLAASSMAQAQAYSEGNDPNARVEESATGNMRAPDGSYDMRSYCNSTPDDAKCRINNMGETNKGG